MSATVRTTATIASTGTAPRLQSIDSLRGAVMIVMALDHVRDFTHSGMFRPEDLSHTTPALFFTRWITHFCAPVFMFLAGTSAFQRLHRHGTKPELSRFLLTRGLWLIFLELTVVQFGLFFNLSHKLWILSVIWALGWSMLALAGLIYLPPRWLAVFSLGMIALHNAFDGVQVSGSLAWLWVVLHRSAPLQIAGLTVVAGYPLIPWIGVMAAGYCFGPVFLFDRAARQRLMPRLGAGLTLAFLSIRFINIYGDPAPWSVQRSWPLTVISFLNCTKYPPSLLFLLMTLGPALLALSWLERFQFSLSHPLIVFGRVPLFYFVIHFWLIHLLAAALMWLRYGDTLMFTNAPPAAGGPRPATGFGFNLWVVYLIWIGVVAALYPACLWFSRLKQRRKDWWLSYL